MTKVERRYRFDMINFRLRHDWSPSEVLIYDEPSRNILMYMMAMIRADEIINKMMRK